MGIRTGGPKTGEVFEAGDLSIGLDSTQISSTPRDHRLRRVAPGTQILVRSRHYRHIYVWGKVCVDAQCSQIMGDAVPQLRCVLYLPCLVCFQSPRTVPIDIHNALDEASLLVT